MSFRRGSSEIISSVKHAFLEKILLKKKHLLNNVRKRISILKLVHYSEGVTEAETSLIGWPSDTVNLSVKLVAFKWRIVKVIPLFSFLTIHKNSEASTSREVNHFN